MNFHAWALGIGYLAAIAVQPAIAESDPYVIDQRDPRYHRADHQPHLYQPVLDR